MHVKSIAECSKGSILQYFRPSLNYHLSFRSLFCLFLSGRFTQVLLLGYEGKLGVSVSHNHFSSLFCKFLYSVTGDSQLNGLSETHIPENEWTS